MGWRKKCAKFCNKRRQFTPVEWPLNDRIYDLLGAEVLYRGQIGVNVSKEQAASVFRVDESNRFLQKFGIYQIIQLHVPQDRHIYIYIYIYIYISHWEIQFSVVWSDSRNSAKSANVSRTRSPDLIIYYTELHSAADKISNPISPERNHLT